MFSPTRPACYCRHRDVSTQRVGFISEDPLAIGFLRRLACSFQIQHEDVDDLDLRSTRHAHQSLLRFANGSSRPFKCMMRDFGPELLWYSCEYQPNYLKFRIQLNRPILVCTLFIVGP